MTSYLFVSDIYQLRFRYLRRERQISKMRPTNACFSEILFLSLQLIVLHNLVTFPFQLNLIRFPSMSVVVYKPTHLAGYRDNSLWLCYKI